MGSDDIFPLVQAGNTKHIGILLVGVKWAVLSPNGINLAKYRPRFNFLKSKTG